MPRAKRYDDINGNELYRMLALGESVVLLDVRTETEYREQHIPGALLIPLQDLESRLKEVPNSGTPIALICEQGLRSESACRRLAEHGVGPLFNLVRGLEGWPGPVTSGLEPNGHHRHGIVPSSFLVENFHHLRKGLALDVAMGEGRNAIYLATRGFDVDGVDVNPQAVTHARAAARKLGAPIRAIVGNFEDGTYIIPINAYDVISVFNYLHRPLFTDIKDGVVPGGVVVYQTYTTEQASFGKPTNPDYLLRPGELKDVFRDWETLAYRERVGPSRRTGEMRAVAAILARRPK